VQAEHREPWRGKNFGDFAKVIGTEWGKDGESFDEIWFRRLVAKGIIFRNLERLVPAQPGM
jgi:hypothetical protein